MTYPIVATLTQTLPMMQKYIDIYLILNQDRILRQDNINKFAAWADDRLIKLTVNKCKDCILW